MGHTQNNSYLDTQPICSIELQAGSTISGYSPEICSESNDITRRFGQKGPGKVDGFHVCSASAVSFYFEDFRNHRFSKEGPSVKENVQ